MTATRPPTLPRAAMLAALLLSVALGRAEDAPPEPDPRGALLFQQIESLRADLAKSAKARKESEALLEELGRKLREDISALQKNYAEEIARREREAEAASAAVKSAKERLSREHEAITREQAAKLASKESEARSLAEQLAKAKAEAARQVAELETTRHQLADLQEAARRRDAENLAARRQSDARIAALTKQTVELEAALGASRAERDKGRDESQRLGDALRDERETSQSKLEALRSVLSNTRSAGADIHAQLDESRKRNSELTRQVTELQASVRKVHDLQTTFQRNELRLRELAQDTAADRKEIDALSSQKTSIAAKLKEAKSEQQSRAESVSQLMRDPTPPPVPEGTEAPGGAEGGDLREQLSLERERRETLEQEVQRLTSSGITENRFVEVWNALQSARSEILVLGNQLAAERRSREDLEVALSRIRKDSNADTKSPGDFASQLAETLAERRSEADHLAEQLKTATEVIVRLKGRLEATGSPLAENKVLADLEQENTKLRDAIKAAEEANQTLQSKAAIAERLAELVYGKTR